MSATLRARPRPHRRPLSATLRPLPASARSSSPLDPLEVRAAAAVHDATGRGPADPLPRDPPNSTASRTAGGASDPDGGVLLRRAMLGVSLACSRFFPALVIGTMIVIVGVNLVKVGAVLAHRTPGLAELRRSGQPRSRHGDRSDSPSPSTCSSPAFCANWP
ncbi:hypothetical protein LV779_12345 [Streptomyces thinghirensis]|nr:hypothetical protein [Streptomyces thinghirensis]